MNKPQQPPDPPTQEGVSPNSNPPQQGDHGIPDGMQDGDAKGLPNSDRQKTETVPTKT